MTKSNVNNWAEIPETKKTEITNFYQTLWADAVYNFLLNNLERVTGVIKKADKESNGEFWYLTLNWECDPILDDTTIVSIGWQKYSAIADITELEETGFLEFYRKQNNPDTLVIYSHHHSLSTKARNTLVFGCNADREEYSMLVDNLPFSAVSLTFPKQMIIDAGEEAIERSTKRQQSKIKKEVIVSEQNREDALYDWLRLQGVNAERQVQTTSKHCIDLWIAEKLMIELKKSSITGNDICQCIEYASEYKLPIVLIGDKLTTAASRGIKGFNKLCPKHKITFITWDSSKDYLRGVLRLK